MPGRRKLGRPTAHRVAMLRGMVTLLLENGQIETTLTRAKEVRSMAEKMITLGKKNTLASRRAALAYITKEDVVSKLFNEIAPGYAKRNGGYTQIFKLGSRRGDAAEMAIVRLIAKDAEETKATAPVEEKAPAVKKTTAAKKPAAKKAEPAVETVASVETPVEAPVEAPAEEKKPAVKRAPAKKAAPKAEEAPAADAAEAPKKRTTTRKAAPKKEEAPAETVEAVAEAPAEAPAGEN